jgi:LysR family hydrogen peroxide-inducible transcriptional activator
MNFRPLPVTLRQLQYVVAVADARSFRRAAELCRVSQPTLSAQVAELEAAIGVRVFDRDRRKVLVTPTGQEIVTRAKRILVDGNDLIEAAARHKDPLRGRLRLGVIPTIAPYLLPELTRPLRRKFPHATLLWVEDKTSKLIADLDTGELDGALLALEAQIGDLEHEIVGTDAFVLAAPPDHPLSKQKGKLSPSELEGAKVLLLDDGHCFRDQVLSVCSQAKSEELEFRATSLGTLTQMVLAGAGVTLLPTIALGIENRAGRLAIRKFTAPEPGRTVALVWRRGSALEPALRAIGSAMRDEYERVLTRLSARKN